MFIVNTPTVFRLIWAAVNPLLEERTRRKIVILGSDFLPTLTQMVPLDNLPTFLGGSSAVPVRIGEKRAAERRWCLNPNMKSTPVSKHVLLWHRNTPRCC